MGRLGVDISDLHEPLRAYLRAHGTTASALARAIGLDAKTVYGVAKGNPTASPFVATAIARAIGFPSEQWLPPTARDRAGGESAAEEIEGRLFPISYCREDRGDFAQLVAAELSRRNLKPWLDVNSIGAGKHWPNAIDGAIRIAAALLVVVTPLSLASRPVTQEIGGARVCEKPIVPLLCAPDLVLPDDLKHYQAVSFLELENRPWDRLAAELKQHLPPQPKAPLYRSNGHTPSGKRSTGSDI